MKQYRSRIVSSLSWWQAMDGGVNISNKSLSKMYSALEQIGLASF